MEESIIRLIVAVLLFFLAGVCNGIMDTLQFHYSVSIFQGKNGLYWNPQLSWRNKYKNGNYVEGPAFWGSTTIFSWLTDGWHFFKMLLLSCLRGAVCVLGGGLLSFSEKVLLEWLIWLCIWFALIPIFSMGFHLMYSFVLKQRVYL